MVLTFMIKRPGIGCRYTRSACRMVSRIVQGIDDNESRAGE